MTNTQLVQYLTDGHTVPEIAAIENISKRTLEKRLISIRHECLCSTLAQLVANYLARQLTTYKFPN